MPLLALRYVIRTLMLSVVGVVGAFMALVLALQISAVPLWPVERLAELVVRERFAPAQLETKGAYLEWSRQHFLPYLSIRQASFANFDGVQVALENLQLIPDGGSFWRAGRLYWSKIRASRAIIQPAPVPIASASSAGGGVGFSQDALNAVQEISIGQIDIRSPDGQARASSNSHFLLKRDDAGRLISSFDLNYRFDGAATKIVGQIFFTADAASEMTLRFENLIPSRLAHFSSVFAALAQVHLPILATGKIHLNESGHAMTGNFQVKAAPGYFMSFGRKLKVDSFFFGAVADFPNHKLILKSGHIKADGMMADWQGGIHYAMAPDGNLQSVDMVLSGKRFDVGLPELFRRPFKSDGFSAKLNYDVPQAKLSLEHLRVRHKAGPLKVAGFVSLSEDMPFDLKVRFSPMSRRDVTALWPTPIAAQTFNWVRQNIVGGRLLGGRLRLATSFRELLDRKSGQPMAEDALLLDVKLANAKVRVLKAWPRLYVPRGRLVLRGKSFVVTGKRGSMPLPAPFGSADDGKGRFVNGRFYLADYRAPGIRAEIDFTAIGEMRRMMYLLRGEPLNLLQGVAFDFNKILGTGTGKVHLSLPLNSAEAVDKRVLYKVTGKASNVDVNGKLGPYEVKQAAGNLRLNNRLLKLTGKGKANDVAVGFDWELPLTEAARKTNPQRLIVKGKLVPQDLVRLEHEWIGRRFDGHISGTLIADGPINQPTSFRVDADITAAKAIPVPLHIEKPPGIPGRMTVRIDNDGEGRVKTFNFRVKVKNKPPIKGRLVLDGALITSFSLTPLTWGDTKNFRMAVKTKDGLRQVRVSADKFDMRSVFSVGNNTLESEATSRINPFSFLGSDYAIKADIKKLMGSHDETLNDVRLVFNGKDTRYEQIDLQGRFKDGSELKGSLERSALFLRKYKLQSKNGGNIFRLLGLAKHVYGGKLMTTGEIFDNQENVKGGVSGIGKFTMLGFRVKEVPILAQLLTLLSIQGLTNTLSGEGIKFRQAKFDYQLKNSIFTIESGQINGSSIGLTLWGDLDVNTAELDMGGTLTPSYSVNSFLSNIPLLGVILAGREGEGVIGLGYKIVGNNGKLTIFSNPFSLFLPGILRRIFELDIGLERDE